MRILIIPILLFAASNPVVKYEPASERTPLLNGDDATEGAPSNEPGESSYARARRTYGAVGTDVNGKKPDDTNAANTGVNTPNQTQGKQSIIIPKTLGEVKRDERVLTWAEVWEKMKKVSPHLWPSTSIKLQFYVVGCIFLLALGRVFTPITPVALGRLVKILTAYQNGDTSRSPWPPFIVFFSVRIIMNGLLYFLQQLLWIPISQFTDREMQMLSFNHLLNLSLAYHTRRNTGEVLKIIDRGSAINNIFQAILFTAAPAIIDIAVAFVIFFIFYGPYIAFQTSVIMVIYIYLSVLGTQRRVATRRQLMDRDIKQRGIISDVLTNWESVKYFTAETREVRRFNDAIKDYQESERKWNLNWQVLYLMQTFLLALGSITGCLLISLRIMQGLLDASQIVVFIQYYQNLSSPLDRLGNLYSQLNRNSIDAEKMLALLSEATEVNDKPGAKDLVVTDGMVEFDDVHFSYDGKVQALKGVSFKIEKGASMALVGESGSGKSTVLRLLYRFYDINSGAIRIDGQDISEVTQLSLRRAIGIVPQDSVLWNDTIGANVSYGKEGATDEEIIEASKAAKLHDRILGFKDQYATIVGERGIRLSGGEKQRVSLARMFLKSPAILVSLRHRSDPLVLTRRVQVLDEATSALDTETEREIQRALAELVSTLCDCRIIAHDFIGERSKFAFYRASTVDNHQLGPDCRAEGWYCHRAWFLQQAAGSRRSVCNNVSDTWQCQYDADRPYRWKNQIFTDAERVAQANAEAGSSRTQSELIDMDDVKDKVDEDIPTENDPSQEQETEPLPSPPHLEAPAQGFEVTTEAPKETEAPAPAPAPATYADAVKEADPDDSHQTGPTSTDSAPAEVQPTVPAPPSDPTRLSGETSRPSLEARQTSFPPLSQTTAETSSTQSQESSQKTGTSDEPKTGEPEKRKRLSSIKGFVRRISDQGVKRAPSLRNGGNKSPMNELDEEAAMGGNAADDNDDKKKKRPSSRG